MLSLIARNIKSRNLLTTKKIKKGQDRLYVQYNFKAFSSPDTLFTVLSWPHHAKATGDHEFSNKKELLRVHCPVLLTVHLKHEGHSIDPRAPKILKWRQIP